MVGMTAAPAGAYEWYRADSGEPLRWFKSEIDFRLSTVEPDDDDVRWFRVEGYYEEAFNAWSDLPGCKIPQVNLVGTTKSRTITTPDSLDEEPDSIGVFIQTTTSWRNVRVDASAAQIALTIIVNNASTGEIVDADIALNDASFLFTTEDDATTGVDLVSVLTHEIGHFYGMEHSADEDATMAAGYGARDTDRLGARTLEQDDIDGICALYETVPDPKTPSTGGDDGGCGGSQNGQTPLWAAFALLFLGLRVCADPKPANPGLGRAARLAYSSQLIAVTWVQMSPSPASPSPVSMPAPPSM